MAFVELTVHMAQSSAHHTHNVTDVVHTVVVLLTTPTYICPYGVVAVQYSKPLMNTQAGSIILCGQEMNPMQCIKRFSLIRLANKRED